MSEAKSAHTPGPWTAGESDDGPVGVTAGPFDFPSLPSGIWVRVATVNRQDNETAANARLIAAAPDLLAAANRLWAAKEALEITDNPRDAKLMRELNNAWLDLWDARNKANGH